MSFILTIFFWSTLNQSKHKRIKHIVANLIFSIKCAQLYNCVCVSVRLCVFACLLQLRAKCLARSSWTVFCQGRLVLGSESGCVSIYVLMCVSVCVPWPPAVHWEAKQCLVLCTYRVLITANSLEPASSLDRIILNPITYWLRYTTEAHSLASCDGYGFVVTSPELQKMNNDTGRMERKEIER